MSLHGQALIIGNKNISVKKGPSKNKSMKEKDGKENNTSKLKKSDNGENKKEKSPDSANVSAVKNKNKIEEPGEYNGLYGC